MKYVTTILMGLLLCQVCSARTLAARGPRETDLPQSRQYKAEDKRGQLFLKSNIHQQLGNTYQQLISPGNYSIQIDNLPELADPIYVGDAIDHYSLMQVRHNNVQFQGLRSTRHAVLDVNLYSQVATVTVNLDNAEIRGHYAGSNLTQNTSGKFTIKLTGNITYVCSYHYRVPDGNNVQVLHSSGRLHYQNSVSQYDFVVSYSPSIQRALQTVLLQTVDDRVHQVLLTKLDDRIRHYIQEYYPNQYDSVEKVMRAGINETVNRMLQTLTKRGVFSIDLSSDAKEIVHSKLRATIIAVRLNGIEKFYLANNQVSYENADKIQAKVQLAINRLTASATISIQETYNEDAPFQRINVDYEIGELMVELRFDKSTCQSGLELRSVQTKINRIRPLNIEKLQSQISYLIEKLTSSMKPYIEEGLTNFIQNKVISIVSQGVLPPTQVKPPTHNLV